MELNFKDRVEIYTALSSKRRDFFEHWKIAHCFKTLPEGEMLEKFWAERIQEINDADLAFRKACGTFV